MESNSSETTGAPEFFDKDCYVQHCDDIIDDIVEKNITTLITRSGTFKICVYLLPELRGDSVEDFVIEGKTLKNTFEKNFHIVEFELTRNNYVLKNIDLDCIENGGDANWHRFFYMIKGAEILIGGNTKHRYPLDSIKYDILVIYENDFLHLKSYVNSL